MSVCSTHRVGGRSWRARAPFAAADRVYHSEHLRFEPVGGAPLRSGFVENIKAKGPRVYAHEIFVLNGARPLATYTVTRNFFFERIATAPCSPSTSRPCGPTPPATRAGTSSSAPSRSPGSQAGTACGGRCATPTNSRLPDAVHRRHPRLTNVNRRSNGTMAPVPVGSRRGGSRIRRRSHTPRWCSCVSSRSVSAGSAGLRGGRDPWAA